MVNVKSLSLHNFMSHKETSVTFPDRGIVLITGKNGSGKSSLIEAVSVTAFGKTLRGTLPWAGRGHARLVTDQLEIERRFGGRRVSKVLFNVNGEEPTSYASPSKAQAVLETHVGSWDVWRRTSVFSSQDASHFSLASDGERKRLLEGLLGLARFDLALKACRTKKKTYEQAELRASSQIEVLKARSKSAEQRVTDAEAMLASIPELEPDGSGEKRDRLAQMVASVHEEVREYRSRYMELDRAGIQEEMRAKEVRRRLTALGEGNCSKCGQPIPEELVANLRAEVTQRLETAQKEKADAQEALATLREEFEELQEEGQALKAKLTKLEEKARASAASVQQRAAAKKALTSAKEEVEAVAEDLAQASADLEMVAPQAAVHGAVEQVLGLRGVRAHILGNVLGGLEQATNVYLAKLFDDAKVKLSPYSEKVKGGFQDAISLKITGDIGGGHGYKGASGGERRRVDVALLLALADVAQAAEGRRGTVWADECFDALDVEGVERVSTVLAEMAVGRTVVVVSHNPDLQRALDVAAHIRVEGGTIR